MSTPLADSVAPYRLPWSAPAGRLVTIACFMAAYLGLDRLGLPHGISILGFAPWDLAGGLAIGLLVVQGPRWAPLVLAADLASNALSGALETHPVQAVLSAALFTVTYAVAANALRNRGGALPLGQRHLLWLVIIAAAAGLGRALSDLIGIPAWGDLGPKVAALRLVEDWTGAFLGVVVAAPMVALLAERRRPEWRRATLEVMLPILLMAGILVLVVRPPSTDPFRYFYLLFLPQIWIAVRFGARGAIVANLVVQLALIAFFLAHPGQSDDPFNYQFHLLALVLSAQFLGVAVSARRDVEASLRRRQAELARVSRLSLAGEMAAALAHELNQPLLATIAFTRSARRLLAKPDDNHEIVVSAMDDAVAQAERAGAIIKALRRYVGKAETDRRAWDFAALAQNALALTQADRTRAGVRLELAADRPISQVIVDAVQVEQVLVNLIQNATHALEKIAGPREVMLSAWHGQGGMMEIEVRDNGPGLPSDMAEQLFEAFAGADLRSGLGLGLIIARGLVEAQGGRLWLARNEPGACAFRFTLPVVSASHDD